MPAKNVHHDLVIDALVADGWTVTHDSYVLKVGDRPLYVDLGAERSAVAAEKGGRRIAVEIQSFLNQSPVRDLHSAVGQYQIYRVVLADHEPGRDLFLAVPNRVAATILTEEIGRVALERLGVRVVAFDDATRRIVRWIEPTATAPPSGG